MRSSLPYVLMLAACTYTNESQLLNDIDCQELEGSIYGVPNLTEELRGHLGTPHKCAMGSTGSRGLDETLAFSFEWDDAIIVSHQDATGEQTLLGSRDPERHDFMHGIATSNDLRLSGETPPETLDHLLKDRAFTVSIWMLYSSD